MLLCRAGWAARNAEWVLRRPSGGGGAPEQPGCAPERRGQVFRRTATSPLPLLPA